MSAIDTSGAHDPSAHHDGHDGHGHDDHPPFLAHHWDTPRQQFEAGKLGMWLFIATEFLLFGGLFCAYAVTRHLHPDLFAWGSQFLSVKWGGINTVVLILSSLTMAMAVTAAQLGRRRLTMGLLALTFLGGVGFMVIKGIEYEKKFADNIVWGARLYVPPVVDEIERVKAEGGTVSPELAAEARAYLEKMEAAAAGADPLAVLRQMGEEDLAPLEPEQPMEVGGAPVEQTTLAPPPRGPQGVATTVLPSEMEDDGHGGHGGHGGGHGADAGHGDDGHADEHGEHAADAGAHGGDHGGGHDHPDPRTDPNTPKNAHVFFGIYFCMTGLHAIHVIIGMSVIAWLFFRTARGDFGPAYFTPVDLGGLYWHVVDMIWIFLFPLLYLIH